MKVTFFGRSLNIHQVHFSDEMYKLLGENYVYALCIPLKEVGFKGGKDFHNRPYCLTVCENEISRKTAYSLALTSDVAIFGADSLMYERIRMKHPSAGLSFEVSERWLKRGWLNVFSPNLLRWLWYYNCGHWDKKPLYKLCSSAYVAGDHFKLHSFIGKCYKWGYFTKVDSIDIEGLMDSTTSKRITIMWVARFLDWKHPELVVQLAKKLKDSGYDVKIDMYGVGARLKETKRLSNQLQVTDIVTFKGSVPNDEVLAAMRQHDIFLFTSDRREGWGAVLNEAMSNGCAVVASDAIGSVPFLIKDGANGLIFRSEDVDSLFKKVVYLIDNPTKKRELAIQAYHNMMNIWSPKSAAHNFMILVNDLNEGRDSSIIEGPCSKAIPV